LIHDPGKGGDNKEPMIDVRQRSKSRENMFEEGSNDDEKEEAYRIVGQYLPGPGTCSVAVMANGELSRTPI
jgi:hypothetical protein